MVEINNFGTPAEFPDGQEIVFKKFIEIILEKAPKLEKFRFDQLPKKLNFDENTTKQFKVLEYKLKKRLLNDNYIRFSDNGKLYMELTEKKGNQSYNNTIESVNLTQNIGQYIGGDNHGIQSSFDKVTHTEIKQTIQPTPKDIKQNPIISFIVKFWWQILVPLAIVVIGILIERGIIDIGI